jgi:8-oxo-dGTP pyrophosphatase MutT (NUDIX family)
MIKHATSSVFVFCETDGVWRLGLIEHPRLGRHMIVGGHVEVDETQAEAALRETVEESGLRVRLLGCPLPSLPSGYPHTRVPPPWWITELMVPADNHLAEPHVHVDHQYVAVAESPISVSEPVHPFGWFGADELADLPMFEDTRLLAGALFPHIAALAAADGTRQWDVLAAVTG